MATPTSLPSGKAGCTAPPTNLPTKPTLTPRNAKHVHRDLLAHNTHNTQLTSLQNTIDEHPAQLWTLSQRQDQTRNHPKHTHQHITHRNIPDKNYKLVRHPQIPESWSPHLHNRFRLAQLWIPREHWQTQDNKYLTNKRHNIFTKIYTQRTTNLSHRHRPLPTRGFPTKTIVQKISAILKPATSTAVAPPRTRITFQPTWKLFSLPSQTICSAHLQPASKPLPLPSLQAFRLHKYTSRGIIPPSLRTVPNTAVHLSSWTTTFTLLDPLTGSKT